MDSRQTYAIFRQERFVGWSAGVTAVDAMTLWIDTSSETETDGTLSRRVLPGPYMAVEKQEAIDRRMI